MKISVDFTKTVGKIKPFHAVNNAPILGSGNFSMFHYLREAGIPFSRLHDTGGEYGKSVFVDIENVFRNFDADETDPASYDFAFTDILLENIMKQGTMPFFRLGTTIENYHRVKAYHIYPPKDNLKWAKICEGIINHYNHGWANGFHYNIVYWEIWNEPDNESEIQNNPMWKGTKEQYFELYHTASVYLKKNFPYIKIGGYASCGFYALTGGFVSDAKSSSRTDYFVEFFEEFLKYISSEQTKSPLDFFSWHSYASCENNCLYTRFAREKLNEYGFAHTENILNEWNPGIHRRGTEADACYILEMMLKLHREPLDMLMYYDGQVHGDYQGLFDPMHHTVFPAYYAIHSFGELYALENEVQSETQGIPCIAAANGTVGKLLLVNTQKEPIPVTLELEGAKITKCRVLEGTNGLVEIPLKEGLMLPEEKIVMLEFTL